MKSWQKDGLNKGEQKAVAEHDAFLAAAGAFLEAARPLLELDVELLDLGRRVVGRVLARVEALLRHRGVATFSDLLASTSELLSDPKIAARERGRMRQLLVDEFQDTDREQCAIVAALALTGEERPGLFLVGDPKQSIFAWRNADLAAFDDFVDRLVDAGGERLALNANFRSHRAILAEVERIVGPVMEQVRGLQPGFEPLEAAGRCARDELAANAEHVTEQYENNRIESDHARLKSRLRPMRGLKRDRSAATVIRGHALVQNLRRGHYELGTHARPGLTVAAAFDELAGAL